MIRVRKFLYCINILLIKLLSMFPECSPLFMLHQQFMDHLKMYQNFDRFNIRLTKQKMSISHELEIVYLVKDLNKEELGEIYIVSHNGICCIRYFAKIQSVELYDLVKHAYTIDTINLQKTSRYVTNSFRLLTNTPV